MTIKKMGCSKVSVDFGKSTDYPLLKTKFGVYNSGIVALDHYERDAELFRETNPQCLRIDLAWGADWGGWAEPPVGGSAEDISYSHDEMDAIAKILNQRGVAPYW